MHYYTCKRCGFSTKRKSVLLSHLKKIKVCVPMYADLNREALCDELKASYGNNGASVPVLNQAIPYDDIDDPKTFMVKIQEENNKLKYDNMILKNEVGALTTKLQSTGGVVGNGNTTATASSSHNTTASSSHNTTASHNVTNNNNIYLNNYHHEDTSYITKEELAKLIAPIYEAIPNTIRAIHFHSDHPENHNVRIPGGKEGASECTACGCSCSKYLMVHRSGSWCCQDKRDVIESLVRKGHTYIDENCCEDVLGQLSCRIRKDFESLMGNVKTYINRNIEGEGAHTQNQPKEKEKEKEEYVAYEDACSRMERMLLNSKANEAAPTLKK